MRTRLFGTPVADVTEVEDCREPPREEGREVNGSRSGNSGGEPEPWSFFFSFFYADCPTRLICQCTL